jgi:hypothetical protein
MISIGEIIYRILENPLLKGVKKSDIVNHVKTVIELVGVPGLKQEKYIKLNIQNYRAQLPDDFLERISVRLEGIRSKVVLTHNTDNHALFNDKVPEGTFSDTVFTHKITTNYIYTDFEEGEIELVYRAYHTDTNGWPMIPKNESLILAIENYIKARYYGILADQNAKFERAYQRAETQYNWYVAQATSSLLTLDPVEAQALASALIRLVPVKDNFYSDDKYAGQPERINRQIW